MKREMSVIVRNRNEADVLPVTFSALRAQKGVEIQLIVVDNESTDHSTRVYRDYEASKVVSLPATEYSPGRALNLGIEQASFEPVLVLSAHSVLLQEDFLLKVIEGLEQDQVAGVRCVQAGLRREAGEWHRPMQLDSTASTNEILLNGLNCACCGLRRSRWAEHPFDPNIEMIEDKIWSMEMLRRGFLIRRVPAVYNYARRATTRETIHRSYRESVAVARTLHQPAPKASILGLVSSLTVGGFRRYLRDVSDTLYSYRLHRRVRADAKKAYRPGPTQ